MSKKSIAVIVPALFAAAILVSTGAYATHKVTISGIVSRGQVKKDCDAAGGLCAGCNAKSGGYTCLVVQTGAGVDCTSKGKCTGYVPRKIHPTHTIGGILHAPSGGIKSSGATVMAKPKRHPVKVTHFKPPSEVERSRFKPASITRSESGHSGGGHRK